MLVRIFNYEVNENWESIKNSLIDVLGTNIDYTKILAKLNNDELQAWYIQDKEDNQIKTVGALVTAIAIDPITNERNLVALSVNSFSFIRDKIWQESLKTLVHWSKSQNIKNIVSYTKNPRVIQMLGMFGASIETRLIKIGVN